MIIGALKLAGQKVAVRGVVSNADERQVGELTEFPLEFRGLDVVCFERGTYANDPPHQKLVVVDGLLAFKGSVNLQQNAMRSAARANDMFEVVTDVTEVIKLNNSYFSPARARRSNLEQVIDADDLPF